LLKALSSPLARLTATLLLCCCVGILGRGYWTPDEPREADLAWRMSWQTEKAVPLLAGEAFCEKPPLTYWLAAVPIRFLGTAAWTSRLPNLLYAVITAIGVGLLARRSAGRFAGGVAAAAISTFLLSYQATIWLATDAPLLAAVSIALLGAYNGFYATTSGARLRGYTLMHAALGVGFLSKSAAAWMVPVLTLLTLVIWERRWRELLRFELYVGLLVQAAMILGWVWFVYTGTDGPAHLKVFFWNNLIGRFARVDAPSELQYAAAHRNSPGKYLIELPLYLFPWTLLVAAAARRAWLERKAPQENGNTENDSQKNDRRDGYRPVRFAIASSVPALVLLSVAATARNVYLAPALPGVALLLAWWAQRLPADRLRSEPDRWDVLALRATAVLLLLAVIVACAALTLVAVDAWTVMQARAEFVVISALGLGAAAALASGARRQARANLSRTAWCLLLAYCALLVGPASQAYRQVDTWQDLASIGHAIGRDAADEPLILFAPDETTRAIIDMYAKTHVGLIPGPVDPPAILRLRTAIAAAPQSLIVVQLPGSPKPKLRRLAEYLNGRGEGQRDAGAPAQLQSQSQSQSPEVGPELPWLSTARLRVAKIYALPHGRRYALLESAATP
jgi:4-amino-4-deoxy-L-arabinose transferase-like glycosyltransferase